MLIMISEIFFHCILPLSPFLLHLLKSLYYVFNFTETWCSWRVYQLYQWFPNFIAYWNHLGIFNKILMPHGPKWFWFNFSELKSSDSHMQPFRMMAACIQKGYHQVAYFNFFGNSYYYKSLLRFPWSKWIFFSLLDHHHFSSLQCSRHSKYI